MAACKAFYNVCAHRGNRLVHNDRGSVMQFTCSFHSWRYNLEGECTHVTDKETFNPKSPVSEHSACARCAASKKPG